MHEKCVPSVHQNASSMPQDLARVVAAWPSLEEKVKARILALIEAER